jgi:hypothetical protein
LTFAHQSRCDNSVRVLASAAIVGLIILHQDWWNWHSVRPFVLSLPVGLWYHALYTICAAVLMALLVRYLWPHNLDAETPKDEDD